MSRVCVTLKIPIPLKKNFKLCVNSFLILYANRLEIQISSLLIKAKLKNRQRFCLLHLFSYDSTDCCRGNRLSKIKLILPSQHRLKYNKKAIKLFFSVVSREESTVDWPSCRSYTMYYRQPLAVFIDTFSKSTEHKLRRILKKQTNGSK